MLQLVAPKRIARFLRGRQLPSPSTTTAAASCLCANNYTHLLMSVNVHYMQARFFAEKKRRRKKEKRRHKETNRHANPQARKMRMQNLHPAAKMKRVISACDYWFSDMNLEKDDFLRRELMDYRGYIRVSALATFPKLQHWTDAGLIADSLKDRSCCKRYQVIYNRELVEKVAINRRRRDRWRALEEEEKANEALREKNAKRREEKIQELEELTERLRSKMLLLQERRERRELVASGESEDKRCRQEELAKKTTYLEGQWSAKTTLEKTACDDIINSKMETANVTGQENGEYSKVHDDFETLGLVDDGTTLEDEEVPSIIKNDGSDLLMHALVRHKKVTLEYLSNLTKRGVENREITDDDNDEIDCNTDVESPEENGACDEKEHIELEKASNKPKRKMLTRYSSRRQIYVVKNSTQLASFCRKLKESISSSESEINAIGFDVEYCTLEMDIRNNLPAMLQLASPQPDGPTGLIWLDKFPNHGKDMLGVDEYKDLFSILDDANILKVGPNVSADAKHLAHWWGITEADYVNFYFSGMTNMETEPDDEIHNKNLQDMCADVLKRNLPKLKEEGTKKNKDLRKMGRRVKTSHWRRDELTEEMKKYAADDASCAIDVWLKVQEIRNHQKHNNSLDMESA